MTPSLLWAPPPTPLERPTINSTIIPLWYPAHHTRTPHSPLPVRGMGIEVIHPPRLPFCPFIPPSLGNSAHITTQVPIPMWEVGNCPPPFHPHKSPCKTPSKSPLIFPLGIRPHFIPLFSPPKLPQFSQEVGNGPRSRGPVGTCSIPASFRPLTYSLVPSATIIPPYKHPQ